MNKHHYQRRVRFSGDILNTIDRESVIFLPALSPEQERYKRSLFFSVKFLGQKIGLEERINPNPKPYEPRTTYYVWSKDPERVKKLKRELERYSAYFFWQQAQKNTDEGNENSKPLRLRVYPQDLYLENRYK